MKNNIHASGIDNGVLVISPMSHHPEHVSVELKGTNESMMEVNELLKLADAIIRKYSPNDTALQRRLGNAYRFGFMKGSVAGSNNPTDYKQGYNDGLEASSWKGGH